MEDTNRLDLLLINLNADSQASSDTIRILEKGYQNTTFEIEVIESEDIAFDYPTMKLQLSRCQAQIILYLCNQNTLHKLKQFMVEEGDKFFALPIIIISPNPEPDEILELLKLGVSDFILPPVNTVDFLPRLLRLVTYQEDYQTDEWRLKEKLGLKQIICASPNFRDEFLKIPVAAESDAQVLITGETGTGKELFARAVHYLSPRSRKPFVPVNCGALPLDIMENELFGHQKGAYTGANTAAEGLIHEAEGGTLFLDDIDCLTPNAQTKLLRFLQEKEYRRLGSKTVRQADVRVIAATNLELSRAVRSGKLRSDLYYRLNVIPLHLPPLRERQEDILLLAQHFLSKFANEFEKHVVGFSPEAKQKLLAHKWPGNVRELEHLVERAVLFADKPLINAQHVFLPGSEKLETLVPFKQAKAQVVEKFERKYIRGVLQAHNGNITHAAQAAQKNRRAFWELIRKYQIDVEQFKPKQKVT